MSRNSLLEAGVKSEGEVTATGLETRTTEFLNEHSTNCPNWPNWPILAKWLSVHLRTKWFWVRVQLQSLIYILVRFLTIIHVLRRNCCIMYLGYSITRREKVQ